MKRKRAKTPEPDTTAPTSNSDNTNTNSISITNSTSDSDNNSNNNINSTSNNNTNPNCTTNNNNIINNSNNNSDSNNNNNINSTNNNGNNINSTSTNTNSSTNTNNSNVTAQKRRVQWLLEKDDPAVSKFITKCLSRFQIKHPLLVIDFLTRLEASYCEGDWGRTVWRMYVRCDLGQGEGYTDIDMMAELLQRFDPDTITTDENTPEPNTATPEDEVTTNCDNDTPKEDDYAMNNNVHITTKDAENMMMDNATMANDADVMPCDDSMTDDADVTKHVDVPIEVNDATAGVGKTNDNYNYNYTPTAAEAVAALLWKDIETRYC